MRFRLTPLLLLLASCGEGPARPRNVVLITIDTLRADHLGLYGYQRPTSPAIDALGRQGVVFDRAIAQAPWTLPSMASVMTSLYPSEHGAVEMESRIPSDVPVLAEVLGRAGFRTHGVVSHHFVSSKHGFARGFTGFDESEIADPEDETSTALTARAIEFLRTVGDEPFFLWVHYFDPHGAYLPHEGIDFAPDYEGDLPDRIVMRKLKRRGKQLKPRDLDYVRARYDGEILHTDRNIGEVLDELRHLGLWDDTLVALTADHGEEFLEHGMLGHGFTCYDEMVRVPLVLGGGAVPPELVGQRHRGRVETRSLPRTLARALGVARHRFGGWDLLQVARSEPAGRHVLTEGSYARGVDRRRRAVLRRRWKLIRHKDDRRIELYDLQADPEELVDLAGRDEVRAVQAELVSILDEWKPVSRVEHIELDESDLERLRAFGYAGEDAPADESLSESPHESSGR